MDKEYKQAIQKKQSQVDNQHEWHTASLLGKWK